MKNAVLRALLLIAGLLFATNAEARVHHGGLSAPIQGPILQAAIINEGNLTRTGKGGERLISVHSNSAAVKPVTVGGVDLWTGRGTTPASWTLAYVSGRSASDFTLPGANVAEGTSAITPIPASTGQNNLTGDYVFNVTAKDAAGNASNTVTLTVHIVNPTGGGCVNYADRDSNLGFFPVGFGTAPNQCILFSTGFNKQGARWIFNIGNSFTQEVVLTDADITRHSSMSNLDISTTSNVTAQDLYLSGDLNGTGATCILCSQTSGSPYTNVKFKRNYGFYSPATMSGNTGLYVYQSSGCTSGCEMDDGGWEYIWTGSTVGTAGNIHRTYFRYYANNCIFTGSINIAVATRTTFDGVTCMSPYTLAGEHGDTMQYADASGVQNVDLLRFMSIDADSVTGAQGPWFGGGINISGYISAGAGLSTPGKVITVTRDFWHSAAANGTQIYSPAGGVLPSDNYIIGSGATIGGHTAVLNIPTDVSVGSPASPVDFFSYGGLNLHSDGVIFVGTSVTGQANGQNQGTSYFKDFTFMKAQLPGVTPDNGPGLSSSSCDIPSLWGGTNTISSGYTQGGYGTRQSTGTLGCAGNTTPTAVVRSASWIQAGCINGSACANADAAFKYGNPQAHLEAITFAQYAAMSTDDIRGITAHWLMPKAGGTLDAGGGVWYGAVKDDGAGHCVWNDGSGIVIPSCTP